GQGDDLVALVHDAGRHGATEAAEVEVGAVDVLHRKTEVGEVAVRGYLHVFQHGHQRVAVVPGRMLARVDDVVAQQCGNRDEREVGNVQFASEIQVVAADVLEHFLAVVTQVHLVDGDYDVLNAQQRGDEGVAPRLRLHAVAGVDQNDRQFTVGCAGGHVARVLLVAGRVGDDELAFGRGEVAVRDVDGDALFALGLQA